MMINCILGFALHIVDNGRDKVSDQAELSHVFLREIFIRKRMGSSTHLNNLDFSLSKMIATMNLFYPLPEILRGLRKEGRSEPQNSKI